MGPAPGLSGWTSWMNWWRRPRLNRAVVSVAALTVLSLSRVCGASLVTAFPLRSGYRFSDHPNHTERREKPSRREIVARDQVTMTSHDHRKSPKKVAGAPVGWRHPRDK